MLFVKLSPKDVLIGIAIAVITSAATAIVCNVLASNVVAYVR